MENIKKRCFWCSWDKLYQDYHDFEWGKVENNDKKLFEMLILEWAQAGLSWITILKKRENYKEVFADFDVEKISKFDTEKLNEILKNPWIIRNKLKINSVVKNAKVFIEIQKEFWSFNKYIWWFVNFKPINNNFEDISEMPTQTELSKKISKDLKKRWMSFVWPVIMYSFMQAVWIVNDHEKECFFK